MSALKLDNLCNGTKDVLIPGFGKIGYVIVSSSIRSRTE